MAVYCKNCYHENVDPSIDESRMIFSQEDEICEGCNEKKPVVMDIKKYPTMTVAECQVETQKHIENVRKYIRFIIDKLDLRGVKHDASKLETPEVELFSEHTLQLAQMTYDSEEYRQALQDLKPALDHHYASNRHHPEHFVNGINDMTLVDILEMFCDWKASTLRQNNGNLMKSIEQNTSRFNIDPQLAQILMNTARMIDEQEE